MCITTKILFHQNDCYIGIVMFVYGHMVFICKFSAKGNSYHYGFYIDGYLALNELGHLIMNGIFNYILSREQFYSGNWSSPMCAPIIGCSWHVNISLGRSLQPRITCWAWGKGPRAPSPICLEPCISHLLYWLFYTHGLASRHRVHLNTSSFE